MATKKTRQLECLDISKIFKKKSSQSRQLKHITNRKEAV